MTNAATTAKLCQSEITTIAAKAMSQGLNMNVAFSIEGYRLLDNDLDFIAWRFFGILNAADVPAI